MTIPSAEHPFSFESSFNSNDPRNRALNRAPTLGVPKETLLVAFGLLSGLLLFWKYTIALGAVMLAVTTFLWAMFERTRDSRKRYEKLGPPVERIRVGATEQGYWLRGADHSAETSWSGVTGGFETNGYLLVQSWHLPRAYFPIEEMRQAGVYDQIKAIVDARSAEVRAKRAEAIAAVNT